MASSSDDEIAEPGGDLASILSYLLQSGQVRLVRGSGSGSFEVSLPSDENESDDTSDDERNRRSPDVDTPPDTSVIDESPLKTTIEKESGELDKKSNSILHRLNQRSIGDGFHSSHKACFSHRYLPNVSETVAQFNSKGFCGLYSQDGNVFMSAWKDQHIRLYDTTRGQFTKFRDIEARDCGWSIVDAAYSPDQNYIIYSSWSNMVHLCSVYGNDDTHMALNLRPTEKRFCAFSVSFSQDSKEILAGASDRCLYMYDLNKEDRVLQITAHDDDVNAVCFADDTSTILISGGDDGLAMVWDRRTLSEERPRPVGTFAGHTDGITFIDPKGDGRYFITNSKDQSIRLWDTRKFSSPETVTEYRRLVANSNWDYRWERVPRRSTRNKSSMRTDSVMTYRGHLVLKTLLRARFSPRLSTGQRYIYTGCASGNIVVYDVLTGQVACKLKGVHSHCVRDVSWHPSQPTIMSTSWDGRISKWEYSALAREHIQCDTEHLHAPKVKTHKR